MPVRPDVEHPTTLPVDDTLAGIFALAFLVLIVVGFIVGIFT